MKLHTERWIDRVLRYSPAQPIFRWRAAESPVVLAYHDVRDADRFAAQMRTLLRTHRPVSAEAFCGAMRGEIRLPRHAVLVTFDDADRSVIERGVPILREYGVPAVVFVVAGLVDTSAPFWWVEVAELLRAGARLPERGSESAEECVRWMKRIPDSRRRAALAGLRASTASVAAGQLQATRAELRALASFGVEVGNHTFSHPCLDRCDDAAVDEEVTRAHDALAETLGRPPRLFAYPNGNGDARVPRLLRRLGYEASFLFDHRIGAFPPPDPFAISRVRVSSTTSADRFRTILSGLHPSVHHMLGRV
jgi:peptidoglycan/xylan/chitin deacetylase (PgdA/CDA1 family)